MFIQALLIAFLNWTSANFSCEILGWSLYCTPLLSGTITGIILGKPMTGLAIAAMIQLAYMGQITAGGVPASDKAYAGFVATALAILSNATPEVAVTIAVSLGFIGLLARNVRQVVNTIWVHQADKCAAAGNFKGIFFYNWVAPHFATFFVYGVPAFFAVYFGAEYFTAFMDSLPAFVLSALQAIGMLLPALGIAMLLKSVFRGIFLPFFLIGFVFATYMGLGIIPLTILGGSFAALYWFFGEKTESEEE